MENEVRSEEAFLSFFIKISALGIIKKRNLYLFPGLVDVIRKIICCGLQLVVRINFEIAAKTICNSFNDFFGYNLLGNGGRQDGVEQFVISSELFLQVLVGFVALRHRRTVTSQHATANQAMTRS